MKKKEDIRPDEIPIKGTSLLISVLGLAIIGFYVAGNIGLNVGLLIGFIIGIYLELKYAKQRRKWQLIKYYRRRKQ